MKIIRSCVCVLVLISILILLASCRHSESTTNMKRTINRLKTFALLVEMNKEIITEHIQENKPYSWRIALVQAVASSQLEMSYINESDKKRCINIAMKFKTTNELSISAGTLDNEEMPGFFVIDGRRYSNQVNSCDVKKGNSNIMIIKETYDDISNGIIKPNAPRFVIVELAHSEIWTHPGIISANDIYTDEVQPIIKGYIMYVTLFGDIGIVDVT